MNSNTKVIALDLQNAKFQNVEKWLNENNLPFNDSFKNELMMIVKNNEKSENSIDLLYVINSIIFGVSYNDTFPKIKFRETLIEDIYKLKPIQTKELKPYANSLKGIFNTIDSSKANHYSVFKKIQIYEEDKNYNYPNFIKTVVAIDISSTGLKYSQLFSPFNDKFKSVLNYFKEKYQCDAILENLQIDKIYFLEKYVLGYTFKLNNLSDGKFFWSIDLEEHLWIMKKNAFDGAILYELDEVLDKISALGINSLTVEEQNFLDNF